MSTIIAFMAIPLILTVFALYVAIAFTPILLGLIIGGADCSYWWGIANVAYLIIMFKLTNMDKERRERNKYDNIRES